MNVLDLENTLRTITFFCLFLTMLIYWIKTSFISNISNSFLEISFLFLSNFFLTLALILRWINANHFPLSNLYESLIFLCWGLSFFVFLLQIQIRENTVGVIITPIILFIHTFATFTLPPDMQKASALVPALQSNWLMMHVTVMILSYSALMVGSLLSLALIIFENFTFNLKNEFSSLSKQSFDVSKSLKINSIELNKIIINSEKEKLLIKLDNVSYRTLGIGFPLLTIGILSGAVWANETWGSYWSWDPKETWALITWFIYAIYFHSRIIKGWKGKKPAYLACFGFFAVWICYLGVNIFGKGLHSYGWFA